MEFLEDAIAGQRLPRPSQLPALNITQAWIKLRASDQHPPTVRQSLLLLEQNARSLHIGESQVRLLTSLAWLHTAPVEISGGIKASVASILGVWVRRRFLHPPKNALHSSSDTLAMHRAAEAFTEMLQEEPDASCEMFVCQAMLLLGAVIAASACDGKRRLIFQTALVEELTIRKAVIVRSCHHLLAEVLAGVGYALTASEDSMLASISGCVFSLWSSPSRDDPHHELPPLEACAMIIRLFEYSGKFRMLDGVLVRGESIVSAPVEVKNLKVAAAAGLLRGGVGSTNVVNLMTEVAIRLQQDVFKEDGEEIFLRRIGEIQECRVSVDRLHQLRCMSFAVASCRGLRAHPAVLKCVVVSLLGDVLGLSWLDSAADVGAAVDRVERQANGFLFREVGGIARAVCEQYKGVNSANQGQIEWLFWSYSRHLYAKLRAFAANGLDLKVLLQENHQFKNVMEAVFLSVVLFFSTAVKQKQMVFDDEDSLKLALHGLDAFSCVEFLRNLQVPEYLDAVKSCVSLVSASSTASLRLTNLLPSHQEIVNGSSQHGWYLDEVQTSRMKFYLRVLPSCLPQLNDSAFESTIVPVIFLYMRHPDKQVAEASHNLFATFVSKGADSVPLEKEASLAEKLGVFYISRAVEAYPEYTPFEGLVTGVNAIAQCLPAGSVTVLHCIDQLVKKAGVLFSASDNVEDARKLHTLLLHLLLTVDMQVLPWLMKQLAKLILSLPPTPRESAVEDTFVRISGIEDIVRKPMFIPWFQSMAYLSKQSRL